MKITRQILSRIRNGGFTLVELMVTLTVVAILLAVGAPSFRNWMQNHRLTTAANDLFAAINLTRSTAVSRLHRVDMVPADGVNWASGWVVFVDQNNDQELNEGEEVIFRSDPLPAGIAFATIFTDNDKQYISYIGTGRTRTNASAQQPQIGTITFAMGDVDCPQGTACRRIKINFLGRARVCNPATDGTCGGTGAE